MRLTPSTSSSTIINGHRATLRTPRLAVPAATAPVSFRACACGRHNSSPLSSETRIVAAGPLRETNRRRSSLNACRRQQRPTAASSTSTSNSGNGSSSSSSNNKDKRYDAVALGNICVDIFVPVDEIPPVSVVKTHETLRRLQSIVEASSSGVGGILGGFGGTDGSGGRASPPSPSSPAATMTMSATATAAAAASPSSSPSSVPKTRLELGGNANFLIAASRLGLRTAAVAHVGEDPAGEFAARELEREGVRVMRPPLLGAAGPPGARGGRDERSTLVCYVLTHAETASHAFCSAYDLGPHPLLLSPSTSPLSPPLSPSLSSSSLSPPPLSSSPLSSSSLSSSSLSSPPLSPRLSPPLSSSSEAEEDETETSTSRTSASPLLPRDAIDILSSTRAVFVNGFAFDELPAGTVLEALGAARDAGALVFFDPGPRVAAMLSAEAGYPSPCSNGFYSTALEAALDAADVVLLTEEEAEAATGLRVAGRGSDAAADAGRAIMFRDYGRRSSGDTDGGDRGRRRTRAVIVKRGAKGAVAVIRGGERGGGERGESSSSSSYERGAPSVDVVDTVGCGDSFAAAFVLASVSGSSGRGDDDSTPPLVALALANAVGAATASCAGAGRAVASPEKVESLLEADAARGDAEAAAALELLRESRGGRRGGE